MQTILTQPYLTEIAAGLGVALAQMLAQCQGVSVRLPLATLAPLASPVFASIHR
jgi:hypothetical protein